MRMLLIAIISMLGGCHFREPAISDADFQELRAALPGMTERCLNAIRYNGINAFRDDAECYRMQRQRLWVGVWNTGWEWTDFCPGATDSCEIQQGDNYWLDYDPEANVPKEVEPGLYRIAFIGRRTEMPGFYGHMGMYKHMIFVDHIISMKLIEARPNV